MRGTASGRADLFRGERVAVQCYGVGVATTIPQRELRNDIGAVLRRVEAGEEFVVTVSGRPVAELRPAVRRRRFVPAAELVAALAPERLSDDVVAALRAVDAEVEAMDDGDDRFVDR